ncbi:hypothetical protein PG988_003825 [Apiospora saccharicola]
MASNLTMPETIGEIADFSDKNTTPTDNGTCHPPNMPEPLSEFHLFGRLPRELKIRILELSLEADGDIEPKQLAYGSNKWELYQANTFDANGDAVLWPQTITRLAIALMADKYLVYALRDKFLRDNTFHFANSRTAERFFGSMKPDDLPKFQNVSLGLPMSALIEIGGLSLMYGKMNNASTFLKSLGSDPNGRDLNLTVVLECSRQCTINDYVTTYNIYILAQFIKYIRHNQPSWPNLPNFNVAIQMGRGNQRYVIEKGSRPPYDVDGAHAGIPRVISAIEHLAGTIHDRKALNLHEQITFKPSEDELHRAYFDTKLYVNGMEREQSHHPTDGECTCTSPNDAHGNNNRRFNPLCGLRNFV